MWTKIDELNFPHYYRKLSHNGKYLGYRDVVKFEHPYFKKCYSEEYYKKWLSNEILKQNSMVVVLNSDVRGNYKKPKQLRGVKPLASIKLTSSTAQIFIKGFDCYINWKTLFVESISKEYVEDGYVKGIYTSHYRINAWIMFTNLGVVDSPISEELFTSKINNSIIYNGVKPSKLDVERLYKGYVEHFNYN